MATYISGACLIAASSLLRATAFPEDVVSAHYLRVPKAAVKVSPKVAEPLSSDDSGVLVLGVAFGIALGIAVMAFARKSITRTKLEKAFDQKWNALQGELKSLMHDVESQKQDVAELREDNASLRHDVESQKQEVTELREDNASLRQEIRSLKDACRQGFVKRKEFADATKLIKEEHLNKMIKDVVNSEMHSICAQEGSNPMKEFSPTRPEMTPEMTLGGDDDHGSPWQEEIRQQDFDEPRRYRVVHKDLVYIREDHNSDSAVLGYKSCGDVVLATGEVNDWLKLADDGGWMLQDGQAQGLGLLLEPVVE